MQMFVVKAVIYVHVLHLVVGYSIYDISCDHNYRCHFRISSQFNVLFVHCDYDALAIRNDFIEVPRPLYINDTNFPSLIKMWRSCKKVRSANDKVRSNVRFSNIGVTMFADNYFCDGPSITYITIDESFITDSTKLGFSPSTKCDTRCNTQITHLRISQSTLQKILNNSFCGLDQLTTLEMSQGEIRDVEIEAFVQLKSLERLNLENNHISIIRPGVFRQLAKLQNLDLSSNKLNGSSFQELKCLNQLKELVLSHNMIDVLPHGLFDEMSRLTSLDIADNLLTTLQGTLTKLTNIESLSISTNKIEEIPSDFKNLTKLKYIYLRSNPIYKFKADDFTNCNELTKIDLSNVSLSNIPIFISKARKMKELDLSHNKFKEIKIGAFDEGVDIDSIDLSFNNLTQITNVFTNCTVKRLILDHNRLTAFSFTDFSFKLIKLSITYNLIHTIDSSSHLMNQKWALKYINLSHNHFRTLSNLNLPLSLTTFDVRNNTITDMSYTDDYTQAMLTNSNGITELYLQNNAFKVICPDLTFSNKPMESYLDGNPLTCSCENRWLSLPFQHKYLKQSTVVNLNTLTCKHQLHGLGNETQLIRNLNEHHYQCPSLTNCSCNIEINNESHYVDNCRVLCPTPCHCYKQLDHSLMHIDCSSKDVNILPLALNDDISLSLEIKVYLANNSILKINSTSFLGLNNTIELFLNWTGLSEIADGSLDHLTVLNVLNLEHNNLRHISEKIFKRLNSLTQLFLSHNQLQTIQTDAFPSRLQTLHLDNNQLVDYSVWKLKNLTKLSLHNNKWSCECQFIEKLRNWLLVKYPDGITMLKTLFCVLPSGEEIEMPLMNFTSEHCYNETVVNNHISGSSEAWTWVLGFSACFITISVIIFIYRREVQVLIYSRLGVRLFYSGEKDELDGKYFDAFIAYSCVDEDFLVNDLMPGLEGINEPYKLCLHHRNFLGGASIIHSIMEAVEFSSRTIILLSDNFMRSEWCRFEFQQAYIQMLKDRCNRLLVIIIDEIPTDLDPEMRLYLRTNTYLKWGDRLFWKKLYFAMPERVEKRLAQQRLVQPRFPQPDIFTTEELPMQIME